MGLLEAKLKRAAFQTMLLLIQQANGRWRPAERLSSEPNWNGKQMNALYERFRIHLERSSIVRFRIFILSIDKCATAASFRRERHGTAWTDERLEGSESSESKFVRLEQLWQLMQIIVLHCAVCVCVLLRGSSSCLWSINRVDRTAHMAHYSNITPTAWPRSLSGCLVD